MRLTSIFFYSCLCVIAVFVMACDALLPAAIPPEETLDGAVDGLNHSQLRMHIAGDEAFNDQLFTVETGLGPCFVASSCGACHAGDGKGHPFTTLTRYAYQDNAGNQFLGAPQLQNRAVPGFDPEILPAGAPHSSFTPPAVTGLGFIELVPDADILAMADPTDADGDGISGVPNWNSIPSFITPAANAVSQNGKYICRFGKKGSTYNLFQQTVTAYNQDMGITSTFLPSNPINYTSGIHPVPSGGPEVTDEAVNAVVFYLQTLKAPLPRNASSVERGKTLFMQIGCERCHRETLKTGPSPVTSLSLQEIHPYTDLLLHDMGAALDDGYTEGSATNAEWRTPPLWGLGLSENSQGGSLFLMHDGRARSIEAAILLHGGEGDYSRTEFGKLSQTDKEALLQFLRLL
jgi:CxxC motif-containing protein (DUF1111 family)